MNPVKFFSFALTALFSLSCSGEEGASKVDTPAGSAMETSFTAIRVIDKDSIREYFHKGDYSPEVYYRFLDLDKEAKEIIAYPDGPWGIALPESSEYNKTQKEPKEVVLKPGQSIQFENENGCGFIRYISKKKRRYEITKSQCGIAHDLQKTVKMIVRRNRFWGERGLYEPASRWGFEFWAGPRMVVSEAEMYFDSLASALKYMHIGSNVFKWVHNDQGYVVGYSETPRRANLIDISLYRYYINGKPALNMPGYDNSKVVLLEEVKAP